MSDPIETEQAPIPAARAREARGMATASDKTRVVVLGGGSGGLELAAQLSARSGLEVVLVDREPAHVWKPRLHEMAAGTVATSLAEISFYLLGQLRGFRFEQGEVVSLDRRRRRVGLAAMPGPGGRPGAAAREIAYDILVVALGGVTPNFGTAGVLENTIRLDGPEDADAFRDRFIALMIEARESGEPAEIVIVGTGPTGTELAAHLRHSERGFLDPSRAKRQGKLLSITLIEAAPTIMPGIDETLRAQIVRRLRSLDVKIVPDAKISQVNADELHTEKGESWSSDLTVWAVGTAANPVLKTLGEFEFDSKGRIVVDDGLRSTLDERIYVIGDSAAFTPPGEERAVPPTAQVAGQQAIYLADALPRSLKGQSVSPFDFSDKGRLVSLGRAGTVGKIGFARKDDILIGGQFALAAYHALERQHQWRVLGKLRGSVAILADLVSPTKGPSLKLHGD